MPTNSHRAKLLLVILSGSLIVGCGKPAEEEAADEQPNRVLGGYTIYTEIPEPVLPEGTVTRTFGPDGGDLSLGDVRILIPENALEEELVLSLIPRAVDEKIWSTRSERIRPVGEPFSLSMRSGQQLPAQIELDYSQVTVPEGWQLRFAQILSPESMILIGSDQLRGENRPGR